MPNQIIIPSPTQEEILAEQKKNDYKVEQPGEASFKYNADYHKMAEFLGLQDQDKMNEEVAKKVAFIRDMTCEKDDL